MRTLAILLLGVAVAAALLMEKALSDEEPVDGWFIPQVDGSVKWQSVEEFRMEMRNIMKKTRAATVVKFYLYRNSNPNTTYEIKIDDAALLSSSPFNKDLPTRIIIHGWLNNYLSPVNVDIRLALFATGEYNVICVDWSDAADNVLYPFAVLKVPEVGKEVADFIDFLSSSGELSMSNLTVIGHSLGAHVSGYAGKNVLGQIKSIIGLDPALPGYSYDDCSERLCVTDAYYVESITTDGGLLGFLKPIGHAAFYANGGESQPGCVLDFFGLCSHGRAITYYAEAIILDNFRSVECANYTQATKKACGDIYSTTVRLGAASNVYLAEGIFYTPVNSQAPFGTG